jgi:hypothetical protein
LKNTDLSYILVKILAKNYPERRYKIGKKPNEFVDLAIETIRQKLEFNNWLFVVIH